MSTPKRIDAPRIDAHRIVLQLAASQLAASLLAEPQKDAAVRSFLSRTASEYWLETPSVGQYGAEPVLWIEDIAAWPGDRMHTEAPRANNRRSAPILLTVGLAFLLLSFYSGQKMLRLEFAGIHTPGAVRSFEVSNSGSSSMAFYPVVEFSTAAHTHIRFRDDAGSNPAPYRVGEAVRVLYLADSPQGAIIDRGLWNGLPSIGVFLLGSLFVYVSARIFRLPQPPPG